jgi:phosphoketolase
MTFEEFVEFLRSDPQFYVDEPEDLLKEAAWIAKQIDGQMPAFFRTIPRLPYGIMPVPEDIAPNLVAGGQLPVGRPDLPAGQPAAARAAAAEHVKPRLLGHWGTTPGLNFIYAHLNRAIKRATST